VYLIDNRLLVFVNHTECFLFLLIDPIYRINIIIFGGFCSFLHQSGEPLEKLYTKDITIEQIVTAMVGDIRDIVPKAGTFLSDLKLHRSFYDRARNNTCIVVTVLLIAVFYYFFQFFLFILW
jgi:hypothetical protein